jgi:hypothetical protein
MSQQTFDWIFFGIMVPWVLFAGWDFLTTRSGPSGRSLIT